MDPALMPSYCKYFHGEADNPFAADPDPYKTFLWESEREILRLFYAHDFSIGQCMMTYMSDCYALRLMNIAPRGERPLSLIAPLYIRYADRFHDGQNAADSFQDFYRTYYASYTD